MHSSLRAILLSERNLTMEVTIVLTSTSASAPIKTALPRHGQRSIITALASTC